MIKYHDPKPGMSFKIDFQGRVYYCHVGSQGNETERSHLQLQKEKEREKYQSKGIEIGVRRQFIINFGVMIQPSLVILNMEIRCGGTNL